MESSYTSKRNLKTQLLCDELQYWGLVSQETDMEAIKVMANVIPERMLMRMIDKLQRKRTISGELHEKRRACFLSLERGT